MPLPGTKVIPTGWSQHHRPTADGQQTGEGTVTRPPSGAAGYFDEALGATVMPDATLLYDGPMRVQRLSAAVSTTTVVIADREVAVREYQVNLPVSRDGVATPEIAVNDLVTVTVCVDDPQLVGRVLRVREVREGTLLWQRDLLCEDIAPTTR